MIPNKYWFSFVEIIVVVSILAVISWFSITSMNTNFEKQALYSEVSNVKNTLKNLDDTLWKEITDYDFYLLTGSRYYYYTNRNYKTLNQSVSLSWNNWTIQTNDTIKNSLDLNIFFNDKKVNNYSFSSTGSFSGSFTSTGRYKMNTVYTDYDLNTIYINSYTYFDTKKDINLSKIEDGSGNIYTWITIKNSIGKTREYYTNTGIIISTPIKLTFEFKWIPIELKIP